MHILLAITQGTWGGAQRYVFDLARGYQRAGHRVSVAIGNNPHTSELWKKLDSAGISLYPLTHMTRSISVMHDLLAVRECAALFREIDPDIIHLNSSKMGIIGSIAHHQSSHRSALLYTAHGWVFREPLPPFKSWLYTMLEKRTATYKDAIITVSKKDQALATSILHCPKEQVHHIPLGITPSAHLSKTQARLLLQQHSSRRIDDNTLILGAIANFYPTKGIDILLQSIVHLSGQSDLPPWHLVLIGDGPDRQRLEQYIRKHDLTEQVSLLGYIDDAQRFLPAFDWYVLPSRKEGFPYVLLEAAAVGIPAIATDVGGVSELVHDGNTGILIPPDAPKTLAEGITRALMTSAEEKTHYAQMLLQSVASHSEEQMIAQTIALLRTLSQEAT